LLPVVLGMFGLFAFAGVAVIAALSNGPAGMMVMLPLIIMGGLFLLLLLFVGLIYGLVAAYEVYQGRQFRYWLIGDLLERT